MKTTMTQSITRILLTVLAFIAITTFLASEFSHRALLWQSPGGKISFVFGHGLIGTTLGPIRSDHWNIAGFSVTHRNRPIGGTFRLFPIIRRSAIAIPAWQLALVFLWLRYRHTRPAIKKVPLGKCKKCNYNLTGNVSGRCPECGEPIAES